MIIKLQQRAIAVYAADAENAEVEAELRDKVEGGFPDDPAVPATQFAAGENNAEVLFTISVLATLRLLVTIRRLL